MQSHDGTLTSSSTPGFGVEVTLSSSPHYRERAVGFLFPGLAVAGEGPTPTLGSRGCQA